ncbi:putative kinase [Luteibacter sp. Sphag1AF]|uniref:AAA family ATPase n=1 Tax=Luteibacter sp. Sphag1AF TaxID=2587031 RepID=UPI0016196D71|nr:ATP-binding protein [Luteibacter sp. Sphag1AF]MBB3225935.1 putative kinase [Luteibacter sp. Sphag1AF]
MSSPQLYMVCGKIAAGKSTLTRQLAGKPQAVVLSEDTLLSQLYPGDIRSIPDYVRCAGRLRTALAPHIESLLRAGMVVVLDFPANTPDSRRWMKQLIDETGVAHELHFLDVPDEICKARLRQRNASGEHAFAPTDAEFDEITRHFVAPTEAEGFHVVRHSVAEPALG